MSLNRYHEEWKRIIAGQTGTDLLRFLNDHVLKAVLARNRYYRRCERTTGHSGICRIVREFEAYIVAGNRELVERCHLDLYGETAYTLWLLGVWLRADLDAVLQRRLNECFKGTSYYEPGPVGFRQFEYELQVIARLVEEEIPFDEGGEATADLVVYSAGEPFRLEIKLPTSNVTTSVEKGVVQVGDAEGVITVCLDCILSELSEDELRPAVTRLAADAASVIGPRENVCVVFEYYDKSLPRTSRVEWIGHPRQQWPVATMLRALTGYSFEGGALPRALV